MNNSPVYKLKRASSEPALARSNSCLVPNRGIDPFRKFPQKHTKNLTIRPTCHKHCKSEKSFVEPKKLEVRYNKPFASPLMAKPKSHRKVVKNCNFKSKIQTGAFTAKNPLIVFQTVNPSFSSKTTERSIAEDNQSYYTIKKAPTVPAKPKLKVPSLNKKMMRRVSSVVFKEKEQSNKTALNISFGDPKCFPFKKLIQLSEL